MASKFLFFPVSWNLNGWTHHCQSSRLFFHSQLRRGSITSVFLRAHIRARIRQYRIHFYKLPTSSTKTERSKELNYFYRFATSHVVEQSYVACYYQMGKVNISKQNQIFCIEFKMKFHLTLLRKLIAHSKQRLH